MTHVQTQLQQIQERLIKNVIVSKDDFFCVYVIDLESRNVVGTVTGVGNDPYGLATVRR